MAEALANHIEPEAAGFVHTVFELNDVNEIENLMNAAGFQEVLVDASSASLRLPPPGDFLWQYILSTPMTALVAPMTDRDRKALERDVVSKWKPFEKNGALHLQMRMVSAMGRK